MESLVPIIIAVAFFVLQAIAAGNKKKEAVRRSMQRPLQPPVYGPRPAAAPPKSPFEQLLEAMREQGSIGDIEEEEIPETIAAVPEEAEKKLYLAYQPMSMEALPAAESTLSAPVVTAIAGEEANAFSLQPKKKHWLATEPFDAGKAIIYSEIIRPKFKAM
ncbi:MAG: hypothetical protein LBI89_03770 [Prevotellaceae bacterium]|jgi:hypothetical protein|nr:hypothetical protein [Prevotellaceae bacterium]